jgi:oxygen-independent coproporphyrinogen-3 oxidase
VQNLDEGTERDMYELAIDRLEAAGFIHHELSNFARPGKECRHNQAYWANDAHWGFGLGAAEYVSGERRINTRDLDGYIRSCLAGESPVQHAETLPPRDRALETMSQNLRRNTGIDRIRFAEQTGFDLDSLVGTALGRLVELGMLDNDASSMRLTRAGKCVADSVIAELWTAALR